MGFTKNSKLSGGYLAFTLSEVLITLGIIGLVAGMTLPGIIYDVNDRALKTAWINTYSTFAQSTQKMITDNGGTYPQGMGVNAGGGCGGAPDGTTYNATVYYTQAMQTLATYYNTSKIVGFGDCGNLLSSMKQAYGSAFPGIKKPDASVDSFTNQSGNGLILNNGSFIFYSQEYDGPYWHSIFPSIDAPHVSLGGNYRQIWVDVNGAKPPNAWGKDFFQINVYEKGIAPVGVNPSTVQLNTCDANGTNYLNCGAWIIQNHDYKVPF